MDTFPEEEHGIISLSLNQDHGCFTCAMNSGMRIYNMEPLGEQMHLGTNIVGSIAKCEMLERTNMIAMVGGGVKQAFAGNTVLIWDDILKKFIFEFTFPFPIKAMKLRRDRLYIVLMNQIYIYSFPRKPVQLKMYETRDNPRGICEVSPLQSSERQLLVFPGYKIGSLQIFDLATMEPGTSAAPVTISAHQNDIVCATLNSQGTLLATASTEGTLIRIFDMESATLIMLLRRGTDSAVFYCINFSQDSEYLCASSDKGTIHLFAMKDTQYNRRSILTNIGVSDCQRAFATFTVAAECECICAFGSHSSVYAICVDGTFHKYIFTKDGKCNRVAFDVFVDMCEDDEFWDESETFPNVQSRWESSR